MVAWEGGWQGLPCGLAPAGRSCYLTLGILILLSPNFHTDSPLKKQGYPVLQMGGDVIEFMFVRKECSLWQSIKSSVVSIASPVSSEGLEA